MQKPYAPRNPHFALFMSLFLPGFGQLYNGEPNKAIWVFLIFSLLFIPGSALVALHLPSFLVVPALFTGLALALAVWLYGMIDAWRSARRSQDYVARSWQSSGLYALVFLICNTLALPALIGYVRAHEVESFRIPSKSMEPGIVHGDVIFADKRYNCPGCKEEVRRGDIAIFIYPNDRTKYYIKRIIGLPGDHVAIKGRIVTVNGRPLTVKQEKSDSGILVTESVDGKTWHAAWTQSSGKTPEADERIPPGQVFVIGDNRGESVDSRFFGTVPLQDVVGKARQIWFSKGSRGIRWARFGKVPE